MAEWDYWPYGVYCENLGWKYLFDGPGPIANMADPGSTFSVIYDRGIYMSYRKGGFAEAEAFKDCVLNRFNSKIQVVSPTPDNLPSPGNFASHLAVKLIPAVARAKQDIQNASMQLMAQRAQTMTFAQKLRAAASAVQPIQLTSKPGLPSIKMIPGMQQLDTSMESPTQLPGVIPASVVGGQACQSGLSESYNGYSYCIMSDVQKSVLSELTPNYVVISTPVEIGPYAVYLSTSSDKVPANQTLMSLADFLADIHGSGKAAVIGIEEGLVGVIGTKDVVVASQLSQSANMNVWMEPSTGWCVGSESCPASNGSMINGQPSSAGTSVPSNTAIIAGAVGMAALFGGLYWYSKK